jgi:glucans biosynthesis protein
MSHRLGAAVVGGLAVLMMVSLGSSLASAFGLDDVSARAEKLAGAPYKAPGNGLPKALKALGYDQYRDIRFRPGRALWHGTGLPFEIMFFHRGFVYEEPVAVHEVTLEGVRDVPFDPEAFDYGKNQIDRGQMQGLGFAGFRVHFSVNRPTYKDETLVFLGASYFRALGRGQRFGMSARGLAIDTAENSGEEFPRFVEFWIERPKAGARELVLYALLDSPRATGAYRFALAPGVSTVLDVDARLFLRRSVEKLALAPLTSMFSFGANQSPSRDDYRPQVHDSDGLSIQASNREWIWRPLVNPKRLLVTSFALNNPRWFGHYEDLEARYDLRPSVWVEPKGSWGAGRVELVQIPVPDETNDNIVAYWVPERPPRPMEAFAYGYRVLWQKDQERRPSFGWVRETRRGQGYTKTPEGSVELHVDFDSPIFTRMPPTARMDAIVSIDSNGEILERYLTRNEVTGGWRFVVRFRRNGGGRAVELRAYLASGDEVMSETWSYILPPG